MKCPQHTLNHKKSKGTVEMISKKELIRALLSQNYPNEKEGLINYLDEALIEDPDEVQEKPDLKR